MITDACLYVDGPIDTFANTAAACGTTRIVAVGNGVTGDTGMITVLGGTHISGKTGRAFLDAVRKAPKNSVIIADAGDNSFNRMVITTKGVHLLDGIAAIPKGGFDHIIAAMAAQHNVGVVVSLAAIIDPKTRRHALSHYADILKLARKYRFRLVIASGASAPAGQKNIHEICALTSLFGMERAEVYRALTCLDEIISPPLTVEVCEGGQ